MVLCWRRHGRAGGCRIPWGCSSVGRAPALQAGGQGFESLHLHCVCTMHFAAKLLSRVQARYTVKFDSAYESKLSTPYQIRLYKELLTVPLYLENRILNQNLKYQVYKTRYTRHPRPGNAKHSRKFATANFCTSKDVQQSKKSFVIKMKAENLSSVTLGTKGLQQWLRSAFIGRRPMNDIYSVNVTPLFQISLCGQAPNGALKNRLRFKVI